MKIANIASIFLVSNLAFANELPSWVERSAKLQSYEQLVGWMKDSKFYWISKTESKEVKIDSGQTAQETEIFLMTFLVVRIES